MKRLKYIKTYEDLGFDIDKNRFGYTVYLIMSNDEQYYIHHMFYIYYGGYFENTLYLPKRSSELTNEVINGIGYKKSADADKWVEVFNKKYDEEDKRPIKFIKNRDDNTLDELLDDQIKIDGWKVVPFFVGAYKL